MTINRLNPSLGSILNVNNGEATGVGLLVYPHYVLTCAHVVSSALGLRDTPINTPQVEICFDFPFLGGTSYKAHIIDWQPQHDIALLAPIQTLPKEAQPYHLADCDPAILKDHEYTAIGFSHGYTKVGVFSYGYIKEVVANGRIQLLGKDGFPIKPGFSGSPVWDDTLQQVVGMVVTVDSQVATKTAFMIAVKTILSSSSQLNEEKFQEIIEKAKNPKSLGPEYFVGKCLRDLFDYPDIRMFCTIYFIDLARNLGTVTTRDEMIVALIVYCNNHKCFEQLWRCLEQERPNAYKEYYDQWEKYAIEIASKH